MKYIKWPDSSENESFKLGVLGESEVTPFLEKLATTKQAGGRPIEIIKISAVGEVNDLDMLFIAAGQLNGETWQELLKVAMDEHIALLTEEDTFPGGGHINFILEENKLFFELDRQAMERAGLRVASELMALARPVQG